MRQDGCGGLPCAAWRTGCSSTITCAAGFTHPGGERIQLAELGHLARRLCGSMRHGLENYAWRNAGSRQRWSRRAGPRSACRGERRSGGSVRTPDGTASRSRQRRSQPRIPLEAPEPAAFRSGQHRGDRGCDRAPRCPQLSPVMTEDYIAKVTSARSARRGIARVNPRASRSRALSREPSARARGSAPTRSPTHPWPMTLVIDVENFCRKPAMEDLDFPWRRRRRFMIRRWPGPFKMAGTEETVSRASLSSSRTKKRRFVWQEREDVFPARRGEPDRDNKARGHHSGGPDFGDALLAQLPRTRQRLRRRTAAITPDEKQFQRSIQRIGVRAHADEQIGA